MEDLLNSIDKSCSISSEDGTTTRKSQYKFNNRTDSNKEKRRIELLEHYKRKREDLLNEKRGLIDDEFEDNEDWMDWQEGCTRAYHKKGYLLAKFKSILPNGSPTSQTKNSDTIILDCIWNETTKQLFALDVLHWKNHPLLDCDAQFRLYWLKSKLSELTQCLLPGIVEDGVYNVFLPHHCNLSTLLTALEDHDPLDVDGILFYHNSAPYISGQTPLVGWLKPYMLPERLGLPVSQNYLDLRPKTYINLEQWVSTVNHYHTREPRKIKHQMETDSSDTSSTVSVCEMEDSGNKPENSMKT